MSIDCLVYKVLSIGCLSLGCLSIGCLSIQRQCANDITLTGISKRPTCKCEVRIELSEDVRSNIVEPGVEGLYRPDGTFCYGRPVLRHSERQFMLSVNSKESGTSALE